jgi:hypothetical protein
MNERKSIPELCKGLYESLMLIMDIFEKLTNFSKKTDLRYK